MVVIVTVVTFRSYTPKTHTNAMIFHTVLRYVPMFALYCNAYRFSIYMYCDSPIQSHTVKWEKDWYLARYEETPLYQPYETKKYVLNKPRKKPHVILFNERKINDTLTKHIPRGLLCNLSVPNS